MTYPDDLPRRPTATTYRDAQRLADVLAAIEAVRSHMERGELTDGLIFDAVSIRLLEIGEAVKALPAPPARRQGAGRDASSRPVSGGPSCVGPRNPGRSRRPCCPRAAADPGLIIDTLDAWLRGAPKAAD